MSIRLEYENLDALQRMQYIDWVDRHYRHYFRGDISRPPDEPQFWPLEQNDRFADHTWRGADVARYLGRSRAALGAFANRLKDPIPRAEDSVGQIWYSPREIRAWAKRNPRIMARHNYV